jgi:hypothetical protein
LIIIVVEKMHSLVLANGRFQDQAWSSNYSELGLYQKFRT